MGGKNFFISKRQKAQMKERRRKKRLANAKKVETGSPVAPEIQGVANTSNEEIVAQQLATEKETSKRPLNDEGGNDLEETSLTRFEDTQPRKKRAMDLRSKVIDGRLHVVMPYFTEAKDIKKFRKEARRKLRSEGKDDKNVVFVEEDNLPPELRIRNKKRAFPSIKQLLADKKRSEKEHREEEKLKQKIHDIPIEEKNKYLALDCEMVGIGTDGKRSALARVSLVNWDLEVVLDTFVKVPVRVTDFRTHVSGVEPKHIKHSNAMEVEQCRKKVAELLKDKVLVGHALTNDFKALMLNHPKADIRDTAKFRPFQRFANGKWRARKLRDLVKENLKGKAGFQEAEHDSVQDARATMEIFQIVRAQWEKEMTEKLK